MENGREQIDHDVMMEMAEEARLKMVTQIEQKYERWLRTHERNEDVFAWTSRGYDDGTDWEDEQGNTQRVSNALAGR